MNKTQPSTTTALGTITFFDKDEDHRVLNVPAAGSDTTVRLQMGAFVARQIHMISIPSAATITWNSKTMVGGKPAWWITLKTTHAPSELEKADIDQYVNRNEADTFIRTALGILVLQKHGIAKRDDLGEVIVKVSAGRLR